MDNAGYTTLTRQAGLLREMSTVANNLANLSTTGFRKEGVIFAEHVKALDGKESSLSMATATVRLTMQQQGTLTQTNGSFDFAIEGGNSLSQIEIEEAVYPFLVSPPMVRVSW